MKISGFTFSRNGSRLYYPIIESIVSIIDLVDEFVVVLGDSEVDDTTESQIKDLNNPKIKIIKTVWDLKNFSDGTIYAHQTNLAKDAWGDWLFYLQGDEVVHEKYLDKIKTSMSNNMNALRSKEFSSATSFGVIINTIIPRDVGIHLK